MDQVMKIELVNQSPNIIFYRNSYHDKHYSIETMIHTNIIKDINSS